MKTLLFVAALAAALGMVPVHADDSLAKSKLCFTCHNADNEIYGPSFKAIAALHRGTDKAATKLAEKIRKGGAEHWGEKAMPSAATRDVKISDAEAERLAHWVLSQ